jgi:hypothetical protein
MDFIKSINGENYYLVDGGANRSLLMNSMSLLRKSGVNFRTESNFGDVALYAKVNVIDPLLMEKFENGLVQAAGIVKMGGVVYNGGEKNVVSYREGNLVSVKVRLNGNDFLNFYLVNEPTNENILDAFAVFQMVQTLRVSIQKCRVNG